MKCYELTNCRFSGTVPEESKCPPHKMQITCWEYDWLSFYASLPDCDEKYDWRDIMLNDCPLCPVYELHKSEIDTMLDSLRNA